jgi:hypothetical protein
MPEISLIEILHQAPKGFITFQRFGKTILQSLTQFHPRQAGAAIASSLLCFQDVCEISEVETNIFSILASTSLVHAPLVIVFVFLHVLFHQIQKRAAHLFDSQLCSY